MPNHETLNREHVSIVYTSMPREDYEIVALLAALRKAGIEHSYCEDELTVSFTSAQRREWLVIKGTYDLHQRL